MDNVLEDAIEAVRWATREINTGGGTDYEYSKWHWMRDINKTLCGREIRVCYVNLFPEFHPLESAVECIQCQKKLESMKNTVKIGVEPE